jgi:hypothetical protein
MADANRMLLDHLARTDLRTVSAVFLDGRIKLPFDPPSRSAPLEAAGPD